ARSSRIFDLVLVDWKMPEMDGVETMRHIMERLDTMTPPLVIMTTAFDRQELTAQMRKTGVPQDKTTVLVKPVTQSGLYNAIVEVFGGVAALGKGPGGQDDMYDIVKGCIGARILLVEDNELNQIVANELLTQRGFRVTIAENGLRALEMLDAQPFDIVLMDIQMPEMDGLTATRHIRQQARFANLPVIAMTAHAMVGDREKSLTAGMNAHITKPIDPKELFSTIAEWYASPKRDDAGMPNELALPPVRTASLIIPGFDTETGLIRVAGNAGLYKRILLKALDEIPRHATSIGKALSVGELPEAQRAAHTLKGLLGNLGAIKGPEEAAALEDAIEAKNGSADIAMHADRLLSILKELIRGLEQFAEANGDYAAPPMDADAAQPLHAVLNELSEQVRARKPLVCKQLLSEARALSWPASCLEQLRELERLTAMYKFPEAQEAIEALRALLPPGTTPQE
ncbi:response regulator, partial [Desulfovibrio sp. OttesenSCG-928-I05]|nr:response regulator [Desulfovibrio sp. OttesenSCG-928-I05]